ncbi:migration and invasion-inhibitory protein [Triplophysa dalaica]|uniref:migration and invasion-inhibitory protein n=1 Tax=Triplophysa dalaica TaxID=1582913 RepID=UPI0024DF36E0|nr:migration and invasion-inhibitory protein [Triplophysa dalaica]
MADLKQLEDLRRQNKRLLEKLTKQAAKLHESKLSRPDEGIAGQSSVCEAFTGCSGQCRAPLAERNRDPTVTGRASEARASYKPKTKLETFKTPGERFDGDGKVPMSDQHKHNHTSALTAYSKLLQDTGNSRLQGHRRTMRPILPKTAPLTQDKMQRDLESTTSLSPEQENHTSSDRQRIQPLLGYDWIAGLVDIESSLSERPEHFFSELQSFRQVNRDECVHSLLSGPPLAADLASSTVKGEEHQEPADMHQCTFCYRINSRLFATPLNPQAACPVCKMPKSNHPCTDAEPAIIRVSIPRSTLLPSYKYNAHRRSSFDPSDSLGLPSHCLSGWSNSTLNSGSLMSSLDLRGSLAKPAAGSTQSFSNNKLDSSLFMQSRHQRSNQHFKVSRLPLYHFQHLDTEMQESHCSPDTSTNH